ncbi:hypothetical protein H0Z09_24425 [Pseudomonas sp. SWRI18]|uniref:hypothetical protein n=1 Tax=Pseudomonas sp. SWRI18 TaxID=2753888 RepID=UPI001648C623|nr:hypothetical protein [Pseudomonas sp. SWRI18]MBC3304284.1 hypothetical protein [Pseudomonas sp. SWRI18]
MSNSGGGSATNSGIDYQQRVAASFVLSMALDLDCSVALGHAKPIKIKKVSFETSDSIDDVKLIHKTSITYVQAKRKLSLSDLPTSDFFKTLEQFYNQHFSSQNSKDSYALITTTETSRKIIIDFKKLTKSVRLNILASTENPLSQSEVDTLEKVTSVFSSITATKKHPPLTLPQLMQLLKKIHIITLDLEQGGTCEGSFLTSIACQLSTAPQLIWHHMIVQTLEWSKNRQSVDAASIKELLGDFIKSIPVRSPKHEPFGLSFDPEKFNLFSGREVLVVKVPNTKNKFALLEEKRFDDQGNFRLKFHDGYVEMQNGKKYELYGRFSTLKSASKVFKDEWTDQKRKLILPNAHTISVVDKEPVALAHSEKIRTALSHTSEISTCIHCGDGLSHDILVIEVNDTDCPFDTGVIHKKCRRPADRILGTGFNPGMEPYPELRDFDYKKWFTLLTDGQALWGGFENINPSVKNVLWTPDEVYQEGSHCIKVTLADHSNKFIQHRGQVQRFSSAQADIHCIDFLDQAKVARQANDPLCYSSDGRSFGNKNTIIRSYHETATPIECIDFKKTPYTRSLSTLHNTCKNFYTPLIAIMGANNKYLPIQDSAVFITNPLTLKDLLKNWTLIPGAHRIEDYKLKIIETDKDFDHFLFTLRTSPTKILIDPYFDAQGGLLRGTQLFHMDDLTHGVDL